MDMPEDRIISDVAHGIYKADDIAARYNLTRQELRAFVSRPTVLRAIQVERAIWMSDGSLDDRLRDLASAATIQKLPSICNLVDDPTAPTPLRIEAIKAMTRLAQPGGREINGRSGSNTGAQFSVTINLPGHTTTITTLEHEPVALEIEAA